MPANNQTASIELQADRWVQKGVCLCHDPITKKTVFVHGAMPGERFEAQITRSRSSHSFATVTKIIDASPERLQSDCSSFPQCGGCSFRQIDYQAEVQLKQALLKDWRYLTQCIESVDFKFHQAQADGYRNQIQLHHAHAHTGYYALHSNRIIDLPASGCKHISPKLNAYIKSQLASMPEGRITFREIQASCMIVAKNKMLSEQLELADGVTLKWQFPSQAFWQSNRFLVPAWLQFMQSLIVDQKFAAFEMFCGSGIIGGVLAPHLDSYLGWDSIGQLIKAARFNFKNLNVKSKFDKIDLYKHRPQLPAQCNLLIANPPRAGLPTRLSQQIATSNISHFIYSSCNPATLNRDLKELLEIGFQASHVAAFDFFPRTPHLEVVVFLQR